MTDVAWCPVPIGGQHKLDGTEFSTADSIFSGKITCNGVDTD